MHKYMILRGNPTLIKKLINKIKKLYCDYEYSKGNIGKLQVMPREIKFYEVAFPASYKNGIKKAIQKKLDEVNKNQNGGVAVHWGPWKKDKFIDGIERI